MEFKDLTPEQQEKVRGCKNAEELIAVAREEGHELSDDELQAISGGDWDCWDVCSKYQVPNTCDTHCPLFGMPR